MQRSTIIVRGGAIWSGVVWSIFARNMLRDHEHDLHFRAVHLGLAAASLGVAAASWKAVRGSWW